MFEQLLELESLASQALCSLYKVYVSTVTEHELHSMLPVPLKYYMIFLVPLLCRHTCHVRYLMIIEFGNVAVVEAVAWIGHPGFYIHS